MRKILIVVLMVVLGSATPCSAEPLGKSAKKWLRTCVTAFNDKDPEVRHSASLAVAALGLDAIPVAVTYTPKIKGDDGWEALAQAFARMGQSDAAKVLLGCKKDWPEDRVDQLRKIRLRLIKNKVVPDAGSGPLKDDPEMEAKVRALLEPLAEEDGYLSGNKVVKRVAAFGRAAIPALVTILRETEDFSDSRYIAWGARDALRRLVDRTDVPLLKEMLVDGIEGAALPLKKIGGTAARDALLAGVEAGTVGRDVVEALREFKSDPVVAAAMVKWLDENGDGGGDEVGVVADFLGDVGATAAVPVLRRLLDVGLDASSRWEVADSLAVLGGKDGLVALMEVLSGDGDTYARFSAGKALNRRTGKTFFKGSHRTMGKPVGNYDKAAKAYAAWWVTAEATITYVPDRRKWVEG